MHYILCNLFSENLTILSKICGFASKAIIFFVCLLATCNAQQVVVVVLDDSGSMNESMRTKTGRSSKMDAAKNALVKVVNTLPDDTKLGIVLLNGNAGTKQVVPLGPLDRPSATQKITRLRAGGGTPLGTAMQAAADDLIAYRKQKIYGTYRLIIITDGQANDPELVSRFTPMILTRGISMDVIGVDMPNTHQLASQVHSYRSVDDAESFEQAVSEILAEPQDEQDAAEDFELIAQLPDQLASEAIAALASVNNTPITRSPIDQQVAANLPSAITINGQPAAATNGFACCGLVPCIMLVMIVMIVIKVLKKKKR